MVRTPAGGDVPASDAEINAIVPPALGQFDRHRVKIVMGAQARVRGRVGRVVGQLQANVFVVDGDDVIVASPREVEVQGMKPYPGLVGRMVQKLCRTRDGGRRPTAEEFEIKEVSVRGHFTAMNTHGFEEKFKFVDHGDVWRFSDEINP
jgi:hypothetical protein